MKLLKLKAIRYRSLRDDTIPLTDLNLFIGANASGKSTILDALRFLHEGVQERDFRPPVSSRGGILNLAWKGEDPREVQLALELEDDDVVYDWVLRFTRDGYDFCVREEMSERRASPPSSTKLLVADAGNGWWRSGGQQVQLALAKTACALAAASADATFPGRVVGKFLGRWGFFDPSPFCLRIGFSGLGSARLDSFGRNLAERLLGLRNSSPETFSRIVAVTRSVLGLPTRIELTEFRDPEYRVYFLQHEPGLSFPVHQGGASSGTLRMLALMTALFGEPESNLIGIEEPENHVHPKALAAFAEYLLKARDRVQILVTTHSPLLLDYLNDPGAVRVVRHTDQDGTRVTRENDPEAVRQALDASGFGLGEFYETKGFGG